MMMFLNTRITTETQGLNKLSTGNYLHFEFLYQGYGIADCKTKGLILLHINDALSKSRNSIEFLTK